MSSSRRQAAFRPRDGGSPRRPCFPGGSGRAGARAAGGLAASHRSVRGRDWKGIGRMTREDLAQLHRVLDELAAEDYRLGPAWEHAHELAQAHEGERTFDRLHALCHRIEGDAGNAAYWYRRAAAEPFEGGFAQEADLVRSAAGD